MTQAPHHHKITLEHLSRKAIVYLRQSSDKQVRENLESQRLQYAMADQARALGWKQVEVIDTDLGSSASAGAPRREGFERLIASVALGEVGIVLSRELSRLSRTDKDWCHLLEVCQLFGTLIGDEEQIYDLNLLDDQLILGIKGTLSVVELKVFRMRLQRGQEEKARRGELLKRLPVGYARAATGEVILQPDKRVRAAISLVFRKFRELWSVRQTFLWFRDHDVQLPANPARGGSKKLVWQIPTQSFIRDVLRNPFYAGAYVWGRRPTEATLVDGALKKRQGRYRRPEECRVFLPNHHPGYIDRQTYEENQRRISRNSVTWSEDETVAAVRAGQGLLAGLLRCGRCGRKLHVRYWGRTGTSARYLCKGDFDAGGAYCLAFGGAFVDRRFSQELLRVISPLGVQASLEAIEQLTASQEERRRALSLQLEQLEYEAHRAFEQYNEVDPRNRLVADELERRWEEKLAEVERVKFRIAELQDAIPPLSSIARERIVALGEQFEQAWRSDPCPADLKKKIIRTVVEEVVVNLDEEANRLNFIIHWKGGVHTQFQMDRIRREAAQRTSVEALDIIRRMAVRFGDDQIASVLNRLGHRTGKDKRWNQNRVATARRNHSIPGRKRAAPDPEVLSLSQAARYCKVSHRTIERLIESGLLSRTQVAPRAPWEIQRSDLDAEPVRGILARLHRSGRLSLKGGCSPGQESLFPENKGVDNARYHE
jgi:DNA invertase Pin-like site-specific DNA recombinase